MAAKRQKKQAPAKQEETKHGRTVVGSFFKKGNLRGALMMDIEFVERMVEEAKKLPALPNGKKRKLFLGYGRRSEYGVFIVAKN